jgi:hypothetical protein
MIFRILFLSLVLIILELYAFQALRTLIKLKWVLVSYQISSVLIFIFIVYSFMQFDRSVGQTRQTLFTMGLVLLVYVPKMVLTLVLLGEDIFRIGAGSINYLIENNDNATFFASRRKFVSQVGLGLAAIPFMSLIYGITIGKYNYKVIKQRIFFPDLPDAFDGFTITQISDVHSGSFDNPEKIKILKDSWARNKEASIQAVDDIIGITHEILNK